LMLVDFDRQLLQIAGFKLRIAPGYRPGVSHTTERLDLINFWIFA
jgi:hypothetical protein